MYTDPDPDLSSLGVKEGLWGNDIMSIAWGQGGQASSISRVGVGS